MFINLRKYVKGLCPIVVCVVELPVDLMVSDANGREFDSRSRRYSIPHYIPIYINIEIRKTS